MNEYCESDQYEYHLTFWGEIDNHKWAERDLGITEKDFWFRSNGDRDEFKARLESVAKAHGVTIAFGENEGRDVRKKTIASMVFTLPDGRSFPYKHDFGYGYPLDAAEYIFMEGNYACDCNISLFISKLHNEVDEFECGDEITVSGFVVDKVNE